MECQLMKESVGHMDARKLHLFTRCPKLEHCGLRACARLDQEVIGPPECVDIPEMLIEQITEGLLVAGRFHCSARQGPNCLAKTQHQRLGPSARIVVHCDQA